jgi:signal transduction histidine kinase
MKRLIWLTVILPVGISLLILVLMTTGLLSDPVIDVEIDESVVVIVIGILLSCMIILNILAQNWRTAIYEQNMIYARAETAAEHRRFLNRLDHELKNPLMAIRAGLVNLAGTTDPETRATIFTSVDSQIQRLSHLITDLRKVADIGVQPLEAGPVNVNELLDEIMLIAREDPNASQRSLSLVLPPSPLPPILGDNDLMLLALHNLVGNALKFTRPGDQIQISGTGVGESVIIEICDTGPGLSTTDQEHIWEELYRGSNAQGVSGSGIGLALVRAIVEHHQGEVSFQSASGQGTVVTLRFPTVTN